MKKIKTVRDLSKGELSKFRARVSKAKLNGMNTTHILRADRPVMEVRKKLRSFEQKTKKRK